MVEKPSIVWYGCHPLNVLPKPVGVVAEAIAIHTTGGSSEIQQLANWFLGGNIQQGLRGSTHFGVDRAGNIGMFVDPASTTVMPIANGQESGSTALVVRENPGISANAYTVSIEHLDAGVPGSVTAIQLERSAWLCAWIWQEYIAPHADRTGATLDLNRLLQHKDFAPTSKPFCASWPQSRMQQHLDRIAILLAPPQPQPQPEPEPGTDWEAAYRSLEQKHAQLDREVEQWTVDDEIGAQLRRARLAELRMWNP